MRLSARLPALATVALTGLTLTGPGTAAASAVPGPAAASGTKLWEALFTAAGRGAAGLGSAVSPDGSALFVAGEATKRVIQAGRATSAGTILAYRTATGTVRWRATYNPGQRSTSTFWALALSPGGATVYVTGQTAPAVGKTASVVTAAYSAATGATLWTNTSVTPGLGSSIAVMPDGSALFVTTGQSIVAYKAATGAVLWTTTLSGTLATAQNVKVSPDGSTLFVRGRNEGTEPTVAAYSTATGAARWTDTLDRIAPAAIAVSPDGSRVVVTGLYLASSTTVYERTAAFDAATGAALWSRRSKGPSGKSFGTAVTVSPDSATVFVTGSSTWAYNAATGATVWQKAVRTFDGNAVITVSPDGSTVFAAGDAAGYSAASAFDTEAFDAATGAVRWMLVHNHPSNGWTSTPAAIEVGPDGARVFVAGQAVSPLPDEVARMATVAYSS